nr:glycosyltransferase [Geothrix sp.]
MRNLLSCFDPSSYTIVTYEQRSKHLDVKLLGVRLFRLHSGRRFRSRGGDWWRRLRQPWLERWAVRLAKRLTPKLILGVYPDMHMLKAAQVAARETRTPLLVYFHDLLDEVWAHTSQSEAASRLQQAVFKEAASVLVTGQGMADHYQATLGLATRCLQIIYPEPLELKPEPIMIADTVFVGGSVYDVNHLSLRRLLDASRVARLELVLATGAGQAYLERLGLVGKGLSIVKYADRGEYLKALQHQGVLGVCLNWPEESGTPEQELATAFPTKVIEYLVAGRPILVHCPEHYFLARFFREHQCGWVVSDRNPAILAEAIQDLTKDRAALVRLRSKALKAAKIFAGARITDILRQEVRDAAQLPWGEKISRFSTRDE